MVNLQTQSNDQLVENRNSSYLGLKHNGTTKVYIGDADVSVANDIKFNRGAGSTIKSNVQDLLRISDREIAYVGQVLEDEDLVNKKYVDGADEELHARGSREFVAWCWGRPRQSRPRDQEGCKCQC